MAKEKLRLLENEKITIQKNNNKFEHQESTLQAEYPYELIETINSINPDNLSPREALEWLYKLKEKQL